MRIVFFIFSLILFRTENRRIQLTLLLHFMPSKHIRALKYKKISKGEKMKKVIAIGVTAMLVLTVALAAY